MNFLTKLLTSKLKPNLNEDETELYSDDANLFRGVQAVGGKLILTNKRLIFLSHILNFNSQKEYIELNKIHSMKKVKTMDLINNGLRITLNNETELKFVINNREKWIEKIEQAKVNM